MTPLFYVELKLTDSRGNAPAAAGLAVKVLHALFSDKPDHYALYLPKKSSFSFLRVFAESLEALNEVISLIGSHPALATMYTVRAVMPVASDHKDGVILSRHRLHGKNNTANKPGYRLEQMKKAEGLPYLTLTSGSNGHQFPLTVKHQKAPFSHGKGGEVNSYGLSKKEQPVILPLF